VEILIEIVVATFWGGALLAFACALTRFLLL
jgi:hypothetical protein